MLMPPVHSAHAACALCFQGHEVARGLLEELYARVDASSCKAWLGFLTALATAEEACYRGDRGGAIESLHRAQTQFRVSVPGGGGVTGHGSVQEGFLRARLQFLDTVVEIKAAAWSWLDDHEWNGGIGREVVMQAVKTARDCVGALKLLERSRLGVDTISISCFQQVIAPLSPVCPVPSPHCRCDRLVRQGLWTSPRCIWLGPNRVRLLLTLLTPVLTLPFS